MNPIKTALAKVQTLAGIDRVMFGLQRALYSPFVRAVNYHGIARENADNFSAQLAWFAAHFTSVDLDALLGLSQHQWPHAKYQPGLILSFDDGLRSFYDVAAPLLEQHGFRGWFFVPSGFIDTPVAEQRAFAGAHHIDVSREAAGARVAMSWDELRDLAARGHMIGSHTVTHHRLSADSSKEQLVAEITESKRRLETELGQRVPAFCWVGGEEQSYSSVAAQAIRDAGYQVSFMTNHDVIRPSTNLLQLQRTNIEADNSLAIMRFQISGAMDVAYTGKRRRVVALTR